MKVEVIDLFCGVGGLTYGLRKAGLDVIAGLDNDESCSFVYEKNNRNAKFISADISDFDFSKLAKLYSDDAYRVLVGCAPCQPFSAHAHKAKDKQVDKRWNLVDHFLSAVKEIKPDVISMENVRGFVSTDVFKSFLNEVDELGYSVSYDVVYCPDYGIPQNRSRMVLLASLHGAIDLPPKTHLKNKYVTVKKKLKGLSALVAGQVDPNDSLHRCKNLADINLNRIRQSVPSGNWEDWEESLLPNCYRKESGQSYKSVYGRMSWDKVAPTITTQFVNYGSGRFGHPSQDRALSLREGAILQTFPKTYNFGKDISFTKTGRHIGNAVPPRLGLVIGKKIIEHIGG